MIKRGKKINLLDEIILKLFNEEPLDVKYRDHQLLGLHKNRRECHIEPDWLLIYKVVEDELILERTGSHSDLFK
jgi:mRNA interferase YafQ